MFTVFRHAGMARFPARSASRPLCIRLPAAFALCLLSTLVTAAQADGDILLVKSADTHLYRQVEETFQAELQQLCGTRPTCPTMRSVTADELADIHTAAYHLVVMMGQKAAHLAKKVSPDTRQLHILISHHDAAEVSTGCGNTAAIYLEQPLRRQLAFIRFVLPDLKRVAVLLGDYSAHHRDDLASLARNSGLDLQFRQVESPDAIGRLLHDLHDEADILLSLPDPSIYNQDTLAGILLSTYRNHIPVIGFSRGMVRSGALAALHSTPETVGREAAQKALALLDGKLESNSYPTRYDYSLNHTVARSLHLRLPTEDEMSRRWRNP
jgi:hypothetical protein